MKDSFLFTKIRCESPEVLPWSLRKQKDNVDVYDSMPDFPKRKGNLLTLKYACYMGSCWDKWGLSNYILSAAALAGCEKSAWIFQKEKPYDCPCL